MHPRHQIDKVYVAKVKGIPNKARLDQLRKGVKSEKDLLKGCRL